MSSGAIWACVGHELSPSHLNSTPLGNSYMWPQKPAFQTQHPLPLITAGSTQTQKASGDKQSLSVPNVHWSRSRTRSPIKPMCTMSPTSAGTHLYPHCNMQNGVPLGALPWTNVTRPYQTARLTCRGSREGR
jgi:hypothetical protein